MVPRPSARDRLLTAARELFYAEGFGVSVDAVTARANVAKPTVYAHFESKDALIDTVLSTASEEWFTELDAELERRDDPLERVSAPFDLLGTNLPDQAYHGCILINSAASFLSADHPAHRALTTHDDRMLEVFEKLAAQAGATDPLDTGRQLLLLYNGVKARGLVDHTGSAARDARAAAMILVTVAR
ncbi:TetR/AcrR family transcriptional regulator [Nocardia panacis]|uniref:TetR/AcrR family transcriptional regulator n=1 Tax=Nocardia panacis TaxID=2340916 RepID=A0A3A4L3T0_9NOCA|nr:TetR/AcrR family transcriptional regulator [Nocardia panacis]RJO76983.1 TetR/AcrR family transcriptional regulator [Nocardia panacis]